jgi:hypothetical protein
MPAVADFVATMKVQFPVLRAAPAVDSRVVASFPKPIRPALLIHSIRSVLVAALSDWTLVSPMITPFKALGFTQAKRL